MLGSVNPDIGSDPFSDPAERGEMEETCGPSAAVVGGTLALDSVAEMGPISVGWVAVGTAAGSESVGAAGCGALRIEES